MSNPATATPSAAPLGSSPFDGGGSPDMSFLNDPANVISPREFYGREQATESEAPPSTDIDDVPGSADGIEGESEPDAPGVSFSGIKPDVVALIKHFAKTSELELTNSRDFKVARQLAERELLIRQNQRSEEPAPQAKDYLDALRDKPRQATGQPAPAEPARVAMETPPAAEPVYLMKHMADIDELAGTFNSPDDAYPVIMDAFGMDEGPEKNRAVVRALTALNIRTTMERVIPQTAMFVRELLRNELSPVFEQASNERTLSMREQVVDTLSKQEDFAGIRDLYEMHSDGTVEVNGRQVPDTNINRVLSEYPWIADIVRKGATDEETHRLTYGARATAAYQLFKATRAESTDSGSVTRAVETGAALERSKRDPVRTALGNGKSPVPTGKQSFASLMGMDQPKITIGSMLDKR